MLLWVFMLSGWMPGGEPAVRRLPLEMVARVLGVMGFVSVGFLLFTLLTSNPFERLLPPADGRPRPEPAAAGPGHGHPPADAVHGLRRLRGGLRLCHGGAAVGPLRRRLGALVAALDDRWPGSS
jgi:cytochrome c biogenesis factor